MPADRPHRGKHRTRDSAELSLREVTFCLHYFDRGNLTAAVHHAFPTPARTDNAAATHGRYLLRKPQIRALLRTLQKEALDTARVTANRVVQGLARNAFADRRTLYDANGALLPVHEWPDDVAATVVEVHSEELYDADGNLRGHLRKVKTERRTESLKLLGEYTGVLGKDRAAATGPGQSAFTIPPKKPVEDAPDGG